MDATAAKFEASCTIQMKMVTISAVTESAAATQTRGSDWRRKVGDYYNFCQCMVLSQLFPAERAPKWFQKTDAGDEFRRARGPFPAVDEHIIPKGQDSVGEAWDVNVHEECNTVCSCYAILSERIRQANGACCQCQMVPTKACLKSMCQKRLKQRQSCIILPVVSRSIASKLKAHRCNFRSCMEGILTS